MKIIVIGTRGIPNILGGVETHCEELYPRMVKLDHEVYLVRRKCYVPEGDDISQYKGVHLKDIFTIRSLTTETVLHTFLAVVWARFKGADLLHIHAIGPALFTPLARLMGMKVVFTHHGPDYNRAKWGPLAKAILRLGERCGTIWANEIIVISEVIKNSLEMKYKRTDSNLIFNGVTPAISSSRTDFLIKLGLKPRKYVFTLGRFVEEKGFDYLIEAFSQMSQQEYFLVVAGDADHEKPYSKHLKKLAKLHNVILPGFVKGEELCQLFSHARLFVLPSYHEGLPISLLEAMSFRLPVLVSDIEANKQVALPTNTYFVTGNTISLKNGLEKILSQEFSYIDYDMNPYNWDKIALQTETVYKKTISCHRTIQ